MDETSPLLRTVSARSEGRLSITSFPRIFDADTARRLSKTLDEPRLSVDYTPGDATEDPLRWPKTAKWAVVIVLILMAFTVTFTCISVVPVASRIVRDLNDGENDRTAAVLIVTVWELGEAIGPFFIGPLSEMYGRHRVLVTVNALFIVAIVLSATCSNIWVFVATRCLTGVFVTANVLNPSIIGDIFEPEERGSALSLTVLAPLLGGALGPAIAGGIADRFGWRAVLWIAVGLASAIEIVFLCAFRETYRVVILRRKAEALRKETGITNLEAACDIELDEVNTRSFWSGITRPFAIFFSSPVLQAMSLFGGISFTWFYLLSTTLPDILEGVYNLSPGLTGLCFVSFSAGSILGLVFCNRALDKFYVSLKRKNEGIGLPEFRLPLVIIGSLILPLSIFLYGWITQHRSPLAVLLADVGFQGACEILSYVPVTSYIVDAFDVYAASAMTAMIVVRCLMGTFVPLTATPLIRELDYGWAFSILAAITLVFGPVPILIYRYGPKWRQGSKYTRTA